MSPPLVGEDFGGLADRIGKRREALLYLEPVWAPRGSSEDWVRCRRSRYPTLMIMRDPPAVARPPTWVALSWTLRS